MLSTPPPALALEVYPCTYTAKNISLASKVVKSKCMRNLMPSPKFRVNRYKAKCGSTGIKFIQRDERPGSFNEPRQLE
jgi:hypothetical protein